MKYGLSFLLTILFGGLFAQTECDEVYIHGKVVDSSAINAFYNMMVVNATTGRAVFGSSDGSFSTYCHAHDSITISIKGIRPFGFRVRPDANCQMRFDTTIYMRQETIRTVVVRPLKTLQQIKEERAALAKRETKTVTGVNILESPITALYQALSRKEKAKRWLAEMRYKDSQRQVLKDLIKLYTSYDILSLPEDEFDQFIDFLNMDPDFLKTASEMELVTFIKDKYEHYQRLKTEAPKVIEEPKRSLFQEKSY